MQFGLFGAAQAQRGGPDVDSSAGFRDYIEYVIEAEALGYQSAFIVEHHFTGFGQVSATLNLLTWIGARTRTLRLGTAVIVLPWHNPVLLAEQAATVDLLSGGRLDFGVGKGYRHNEFVGFRIPMEEAEPRFEESIDIITKAWTSNERFSWQGQYWQFDDIVVEPPTLQKPHPPFWQGAGHHESIRRVARRGHNLLLDQFASLDATGERFAIYRDAMQTNGFAFHPSQVGVAPPSMWHATARRRRRRWTAVSPHSADCMRSRSDRMATTQPASWLFPIRARRARRVRCTATPTRSRARSNGCAIWAWNTSC
jgi:alkanesulfonate monooxygenase SsuD/methylene tetrahydromethanopterin reductase-like flavin-dependent oxidoreductase (luciferase family)